MEDLAKVRRQVEDHLRKNTAAVLPVAAELGIVPGGRNRENYIKELFMFLDNREKISRLDRYFRLLFEERKIKVLKKIGAEVPLDAELEKIREIKRGYDEGKVVKEYFYDFAIFGIEMVPHFIPLSQEGARWYFLLEVFKRIEDLHISKNLRLRQKLETLVSLEFPWDFTTTGKEVFLATFHYLYLMVYGKKGPGPGYGDSMSRG